MQINEKVKAQRESLGLSKAEVARSSGMGLDNYFDIELYPDELISLVPLRSLKKLCEVLQLNPLALLSVPCAFCEEGRDFEGGYRLPRNELIRRCRTALGLSTDALGERVNYNAVEIQLLEADEEYIENWRVNDIRDLSAVLAVPLQILMQVRCQKCGR